jgi:peptidoglycan/xylan/chitin deacetylase (PgdA/CDA1 family)
MRFLTRVDDIGFSGDAADDFPLKKPDTGLRLARAFHDAMNGVPYLGALIPASVVNDVEAKQWLSSKPDGLTVALHGWDHTTSGGVRHEFHCLTPDQQRARVAAGQALLLDCTGSKTRHYVPPFNAVTCETLDILHAEEIDYVWGGANHDDVSPSRWDTPPPPYPARGTTFIPSWYPLYGATCKRMGEGTVAPLLETIPGMLETPGFAVIVVHIPWEVTSAPLFKGVEALAAMIAPYALSPEGFIAAACVGKQ